MEKHSNAMSTNTYIIPRMPALAFYWKFNYGVNYSSVVYALQKYTGID